jgi:transposase
VTRNGDTHDASRPRRPIKISATKKTIVEGIVDNEPFLALRDIAEKVNVWLRKTTVDKIIGDAGFKLIIPEKEAILEERAKAKQNRFCK